ncbi:MAG: MFS transporter [Nitrospiraceae bacterium]|nr:MFS transporter [Nitrospiraceae bacterium]
MLHDIRGSIVLTSLDKPVTRKELWAWCMYDFANSSFTTLIVTVAYSVYFVQVVAAHLGDGSAERVWFWGYAASMFVAVLLSPTLGALADARAAKRRFLIVSTLVCVVCTAFLSFVGPGDIWLGLILFGIANVAFDLGFLFCSAFLVEITTQEMMGRISGYGWGLGYVGGLLCLALAYPFIKGGLGAENLGLYRFSFAVTALFFFLASLPTFLFLRERAVPSPIDPGTSPWREALARLGRTARQVSRYRDLATYLISYLIYTDAINTVIVASAIFANKVLDFSPGDLIIYFLITQITAGLGAVGFGVLADRIGAKRTISITLILWVALSIGAALVQTHGQFYMIGLVAGAALGANQSASRMLLGRFTPIGRQAEFFGFFSVTGKFAAIVGPVVYGEVTAWTGSQRWAVLSMAIFFAAGLAAFQIVDEQRGMAAAANAGNRGMKSKAVSS